MGWMTLDYSHAPVHGSNCAIPQNKSTWESMNWAKRMAIGTNMKSYPEAPKTQIHDISEQIVWYVTPYAM